MSKAEHKSDTGGQSDSQETGKLVAVRNVAGRAVGDLDANPLLALIGGLAVGAIAGALIPRSDKERELLEPVGQRVGHAGRAALEAAKSAASETLDEGGINADNLRHQVAGLVEQLFKAVDNAGTAAVGAVRQSAGG